jgi:hypothetical protein
MMTVKVRQDIRQQARDKSLDDPDADFAASEAAKVVDPGASAVKIAENAVALPGQDFASRSELNAAFGPFEKYRVEFVLELRDLPAHRRWRDVQPIGSLPNGT